MPLGPTKAGKSTFLGATTKMTGFFLSGERKETSFFWEYKESNSQKPFIFTQSSHLGKEIDEQSFDDVIDLKKLIKTFSNSDPNNS